MNWFGSGFVAIINYGSLGESVEESFTIVTESGNDLLTESGSALLMENA